MASPRNPDPVRLERRRLDGDGVAAHLAALATAQALEIRVKGATTAYSDASTGQLDEVARRLRAGEIVAVQVRYLEGDAWWCDTVMRAGDDFRLVRMRQDEPDLG